MNKRLCAFKTISQNIIMVCTHLNICQVCTTNIFISIDRMSAQYNSKHLTVLCNSTTVVHIEDSQCVLWFFDCQYMCMFLNNFGVTIRTYNVPVLIEGFHCTFKLI